MHTVTGKLNKSANKFQAGEYTGFGVRLGVQYYDRKTKQKEWTNYSAALFASQPAKIKFYEDVLVEGAIISVSGSTLKIEEYEGNYSLSINDAVLGYTFTHHLNEQTQQPAPITTENFVLPDDEKLPF